jgi:hypothetical protein
VRITGKGGYYPRQVTGKIQLEAVLRSDDSAYINQGALGAQFLVAANAIIGDEAMNAAIREIASIRSRRTGQQVLESLMDHTTEPGRPRLEALVRDRFER